MSVSNSPVTPSFTSYMKKADQFFLSRRSKSRRRTQIVIMSTTLPGRSVTTTNAALQKKARGLKPPTSPVHLKSSKSISLVRGIKTLEDFGFSSEAFNPTLPARNAHILPSEQRSPTSVHVSDLWSHRQQRLFLRKTGLKEAQNARERQQRLEVYLAQRNKVEGAHVTDELYQRILAEDNPQEAAKFYAAGKNGRFLKQLTNQLRSNPTRHTSIRTTKIGAPRRSIKKPQTSSVQRLEELLFRCEATLTDTQSSRQ